MTEGVQAAQEAQHPSLDDETLRMEHYQRKAPPAPKCSIMLREAMTKVLNDGGIMGRYPGFDVVFPTEVIHRMNLLFQAVISIFIRESHAEWQRSDALRPGVYKKVNTSKLQYFFLANGSGVMTPFMRCVICAQDSERPIPDDIDWARYAARHIELIDNNPMKSMTGLPLSDRAVTKAVTEAERTLGG